MSSLILEIGTGDGTTAYAFAQRGDTVQAFEPSTTMRNIAYERLRDLPNAILMPYAIGGNDRQTTLYRCNGSHASLHETGEPHEGCTVVSMNHWFVTARIGEVDVLLLDCNGSEYEILEQMIECDRIKQVRQLCITWNGEQPERKAAICDVLTETHRKICDGFQQWIRKDVAQDGQKVGS